MRKWYYVVSNASWTNLTDVRRHFPHADPVVVASDAVMTVFNVGGNKFRLIAKIDYQRHKVYVKEVLTHAEYSPQKWKDRL